MMRQTNQHLLDWALKLAKVNLNWGMIEQVWCRNQEPENDMFCEAVPSSFAGMQEVHRKSPFDDCCCCCTWVVGHMQGIAPIK
jgi:hypothetical protein